MTFNGPQLTSCISFFKFLTKDLQRRRTVRGDLRTPSSTTDANFHGAFDHLNAIVLFSLKIGRPAIPPKIASLRPLVSNLILEKTETRPRWRRHPMISLQVRK